MACIDLVVAGLALELVENSKFDIMAKAEKHHDEKYETWLAIKGGFADIIKVSVLPKPAGEKVQPKKDKTKKK